VFIDLIRAESAGEPSATMVATVARKAAMIARSAPPAGATSDAHSPRRLAGWKLRRQFAVAATAVLLFSATSGVAVAANRAAPGDALYGIDRALEKIGIGAGGAQERLVEAKALLSDGAVQEALRHAADVYEDAEELSEVHDEVGDARAALENAGRSLDDNGATSNVVARENVSTLIEYLRENLGQQEGADERDFGQGVADLARDIAGGEGDAPTPEPSDANGRRDEHGGGPQGGGSGNGGGGGNGAPGGSGAAPGQNPDS
jgi:uncharacterized membrane protein YgcG